MGRYLRCVDGYPGFFCLHHMSWPYSRVSSQNHALAEQNRAGELLFQRGDIWKRLRYLNDAAGKGIFQEKTWKTCRAHIERF